MMSIVTAHDLSEVFKVSLFMLPLAPKVTALAVVSAS